VKKLISAVLVSTFMLTLAACGSGNPTAANQFSDNPSGSVSNSTGQNSRRGGAGGFGGWNQGQAADVTGEITSVSGNQITLKLVKMPSFSRNGAPPSGNSSPGAIGGPAGDSGPAKSGDNPAQGTNPARRSGNQAPDNGGERRGSGDRYQGNGQRQARIMEYTGETKTITVPEGVSITAMGGRPGNDNGSEKSDLKVSDLAKGNVLQIWYSEEDKDTISRITVMQAIQGPEDGSGNSGTQVQ